MFSIIVSIIFTTMVSFIIWFRINFVLYKRKVDKMLEKVEMFRGNLPIFGHLLYFADKDLEDSAGVYKFVLELKQFIHTDVRVWIMNVPFVIAVKPETIEKILTSHVAVKKNFIYSFMDVFINGVLTTNNDKWKKLRKRINTTFKSKYLPNYIEQMNRQTNVFMSQLNKRLNEGNTEYNDVQPYIAKYFFDLNSSTHFGVNTNSQLKTIPTFAEQAARSMKYVELRILRPWLHPEFIFKRTKLYQAMKQLTAPYEHQSNNILKKTIEYQEKINSSGNTLGWKSYAIHCKEVLEELGHKTSSCDVAKTFNDLFVAGSDTTSVGLSHLIYQLGLHPEYQEIAYNEIMNVLNNDILDNSSLNSDNTQIKMNGYENDKLINKESQTILTENNLSDNNNRIVNEKSTESDLNDDSNWTFTKMTTDSSITWTKSKLNSLCLMEQMIMESLRLCAPPVLFRELEGDIDMGDYIMPKGTNVAIPTMHIHTNPAYWEKYDKFYPEHFDPEKVKQRPKYSFAAFSYGPRGCPGKYFGIYGMKCLLAEIIKNYKIETMPTTTPVAIHAFLMIEHIDGYPVKFIPR